MKRARIVLINTCAVIVVMVMLFAGCKAMEQMFTTPADPSTPNGPTQGEAAASTIGTTTSVITGNPLLGFLIAGGAKLVADAFKTKKAQPPVVPTP